MTYLIYLLVLVILASALGIARIVYLMERKRKKKEIIVVIPSNEQSPQDKFILINRNSPKVGPLKVATDNIISKGGDIDLTIISANDSTTTLEAIRDKVINRENEIILINKERKRDGSFRDHTKKFK